jgi:hypothetical protein
MGSALLKVNRLTGLFKVIRHRDIAIIRVMSAGTPQEAHHPVYTFVAGLPMTKMRPTSSAPEYSDCARFPSTAGPGDPAVVTAAEDSTGRFSSVGIHDYSRSPQRGQNEILTPPPPADSEMTAIHFRDFDHHS